MFCGSTLWGVLMLSFILMFVLAGIFYWFVEV